MGILTYSGAAAEVVADASTVQASGARLVLYFYSPDIATHPIHSQLAAIRGDAQVMGCSMIGGWGPDGPREDGVVLMSLGEEEVESVHVAAARGMKTDPVAAADSVVEQLAGKLPLSSLSPAQYVGIVLLDDLDLGEKVIRRLSESLSV